MLLYPKKYEIEIHLNIQPSGLHFIIVHGGACVPVKLHFYWVYPSFFHGYTEVGGVSQRGCSGVLILTITMCAFAAHLRWHIHGSNFQRLSKECVHEQLMSRVHKLFVEDMLANLHAHVVVSVCTMIYTKNCVPFL